jgi:hypothetical protein
VEEAFTRSSPVTCCGINGVEYLDTTPRELVS